MGAVFGASRHSPVQILFADSSKPPDDGNSFGSDFQRLASVSTSPLRSTAKSWQTYPVRARSPEENSGIPLGQWCAERASEAIQADRLKADPLAPKFVGEALERWRTSFHEAINADETFERDRSSEMQRVRYGIPVCAGPFVRAFDVESVRAQLGEIVLLNDEISRMEADAQSTPEGVPKKMLLKNLNDLAALADAMGTLTMNLHGRRTNALRAELGTLIALNDMAREAEREMTNGGADVPLRLAVRNGNWVLKPAVSTSWFSHNKTRAANDSARLALLLGYPADQPVTLKMIRDRGFGVHEYTSVLNDARLAGPEATHSWLAGRALDIDAWKTGHTAQHIGTHAAERRALDGTSVSADSGNMPDDDCLSVDSFELVTDPGYADIPLPPMRAPTSSKPRQVLTSDESVSVQALASHEKRQRHVAGQQGTSGVPRSPAPDGGLYSLVTRLKVAQGGTPGSRQEPFATAFCSGSPVRTVSAHRSREPFEGVDLPVSESAAYDRSRHSSGRARLFQSPPPLPSSPAPSLTPIPESDAD